MSAIDIGPILTIGFTKKSAEEFFCLLERAGVQSLIDVRLHRDTQLSGFAKSRDLKFFLKRLLGIEYLHFPELAPTEEMFRAYKNKEKTWDWYQASYLDLLGARAVERSVDFHSLRCGCLLCSEHDPAKCHRRLVVDYFVASGFTFSSIKHLK